MPPLRERFSLGFVKDLLQRHQSISPEGKPLELPAVGGQLATLDQALVQLRELGQPGEPLFHGRIRRGEQQGECLLRLVGEPCWQQCFMAVSSQFCGLAVHNLIIAAQ